MQELPGAVLFACSMNAVRSPIAAALMRAYFGHRVFVDSCGVYAGEVDGFAIAVMDEIGLDLVAHQPKSFAELDNDFFDLIISLSPEAQHSAVEMTRTAPIEVEFWHMPDPSLIDGSRDQRLAGYRALRDRLADKIKARFPTGPLPRF